jgi:hypothetical protein
MQGLRVEPNLDLEQFYFHAVFPVAKLSWRESLFLGYKIIYFWVAKNGDRGSDVYVVLGRINNVVFPVVDADASSPAPPFPYTLHSRSFPSTSWMVATYRLSAVYSLHRFTWKH